MLRILPLLLVSVFLATAAGADNGLVKIKSAHNVPETLDRLENAVAEKGMTVFARIDHSGGAGKVGEQLRPTQLLIFGNPKVGTLLMQSNQDAGIDLPLKALAWEDSNGDVWLTYNDPAYLASRHGITDRETVIEKMRKAMRAFSRTATGQ
jgi:uncharacterized protein (DUF302 family)